MQKCSYIKISAMDNIFANHLRDLSKKSYNNSIYTFTNFLSLDELDTLTRISRELTSCTLFGGCEGCQRVVARFGSIDDFGYEEQFPITCIKVSPTLKKFADALTHRDFLGALMNLGIRRDFIGDIFIKDCFAYIFVLDRIADYVIENLSKIKHTAVKSQKFDFTDIAFYTLVDEKIIVSSLRLDCIICAKYKISRSDCIEMFKDGKIYVNGKNCQNISHNASDGETISVRGFGRFIVGSASGVSKKGRIYLNIQTYA